MTIHVILNCLTNLRISLGKKSNHTDTAHLQCSAADLNWTTNSTCVLIFLHKVTNDDRSVEKVAGDNGNEQLYL